MSPFGCWEFLETRKSAQRFLAGVEQTRRGRGTLSTTLGGVRVVRAHAVSTVVPVKDLPMATTAVGQHGCHRSSRRVGGIRGHGSIPGVGT